MQKRYVVEMSLFVYAKDDETAVAKAKKLRKLFDNCGSIISKELSDCEINLLKEQNDNKCGVVTISERPFGKLELRKVKL